MYEYNSLVTSTIHWNPLPYHFLPRKLTFIRTASIRLLIVNSRLISLSKEFVSFSAPRLADEAAHVCVCVGRIVAHMETPFRQERFAYGSGSESTNRRLHFKGVLHVHAPQSTADCGRGAGYSTKKREKEARACVGVYNRGDFHGRNASGATDFRNIFISVEEPRSSTVLQSVRSQRN